MSSAFHSPVSLSGGSLICSSDGLSTGSLDSPSIITRSVLDSTLYLRERPPLYGLLSALTDELNSVLGDQEMCETWYPVILDRAHRILRTDSDTRYKEALTELAPLGDKKYPELFRARDLFTENDIFMLLEADPSPGPLVDENSSDSDRYRAQRMLDPPLSLEIECIPPVYTVPEGDLKAQILERGFTLGRIDAVEQSVDNFRLWGPMNPVGVKGKRGYITANYFEVMDHNRYGAHRMLYPEKLDPPSGATAGSYSEHRAEKGDPSTVSSGLRSRILGSRVYLTENVPLWFTGECLLCKALIKEIYCAVRKPYLGGGWSGCYCSWNCVRTDIRVNTVYRWGGDDLASSLAQESLVNELEAACIVHGVSR